MRTLILLTTLMVLAAGCASAPDTPSTTPTTTATPAVTTTPNDAPTPAPTLPAGAACDQPLPARSDAWTSKGPRILMNTSAGSFVVELATEQAPITSDHFLNLTREGVYDGTLFHRVIAGFVIQGGDPLSKDEDPRNDGTGGALDANGKEIVIPDEFNPSMRHDAEGVLSMANSGPNTGSSQFFVTLAATPHLDDRHTVFGRVVEGLDTIRAIGAMQVDANDRPVEEVRLLNATILAPLTGEATHEVGVHVVVPVKKGEAGRGVRYAVVLENKGNVRDVLAVTAEPPAGWTCTADAPAVVNAGTGHVAFLTLTPPAGATGVHHVVVSVRAASGEKATDTASVRIATLGPQVKQGDRVMANYAGLLPDGRLFDTSMQSVGTDADQPKFTTLGGWREKSSYNSFPFTVGSGVIEGFTSLAKTARVGETVTGYIPAKDAYATGNPYERPLTGRDLIFELEIISVN